MRNLTLLVFVMVCMAAPLVALAAEGSDAPAPLKPVIQASIDVAADGPLFTYITGKTYKVTVKIENRGQGEVKLDKVDLTWKADKELAVDVKPDGAAPTSLAAGASGSAVYNVTFPEQAAGRQLTLCANINCGGATEKAETVMLVSSPLEITLLPGRLILYPTDETRNVGMSVINHTESAFEGKIKFSPFQGIEVKPAEVDAKIDALGLEAYVLAVAAPGKPAPGHYAVFVDVAGKAKDWVAVDVPLVVKKAEKEIKVDGDLKDWKDATAVSISRAVTTDGKTTYETVGKAMFSYDSSRFYVAFVSNGKEPASRSAKIAFDCLADAAKTPSGGYKDDDIEYSFTDSGVAVSYPQSPQNNDTACSFGKGNPKSLCEIGFSWKDFKSFKPEKGKMFAISILVNDSDGSKVTQYEFGGGIAPKIDPRMFVPVVLAD